MRSNIGLLLKRRDLNFADPATPIVTLLWTEWSAVSVLTLTFGGTAYTSAAVAFTPVGGPGSGAAATAQITFGVVTGLTLTANGSGYLAPPTVTITGDGNGATATCALYRLDPTTGSKIGKTVSRSLEVKALLHFTNATTGVRLFNEVEVGSCLADFPPDAPLDGKDDLQFVIAGENWVQAKVGGKLAKTWPVRIADQLLYRTVLLEKAS